MQLGDVSLGSVPNSVNEHDLISCLRTTISMEFVSFLRTCSSAYILQDY